MRRRRHCSRSVTVVSVPLGVAPPAATAILGSDAGLPPALSVPSLSVWFLGMRKRVLAPGPSVKSFAAQVVTVGRVTWRRHWPICTTSGMLLPEGASVRVNEPSVAVSAAAMGSPDGVAHWPHTGPVLGLAWTMGSTALLGT